MRETAEKQSAKQAPPGIGPAIKALRVNAGMTLEDVVVAAGVSLSYLSRAENNLVSPSPAWVSLVAVAIGDHLAREPVAQTG